jgi:hypothetical protein
MFISLNKEEEKILGTENKKDFKGVNSFLFSVPKIFSSSLFNEINI